MNILILAAGETELNLDNDQYPFYLTEFEGVSLLERLIKQCETIQQANYLFAFSELEIKRWRLDNVVTQLVPNSQLVRIPGKTAGAACTALLAVEHIDKDEPLLIINATDMWQVNFAEIVQDFEKRRLDAGTIVFHSIHPRYSYVALDDNGWVVEAAEKNPISQHATAGFYWFARGSDFVVACRSMITKDSHVNGLFYICPVFNEMILSQAKIGVSMINHQQYHPLKSMRQMQHYDSVLEAGKQP